MAKEFETYEQIEKYLNGELSGEELAIFEKRLSEDETFANEVELHRQAEQFVVLDELQELNDRVKSFKPDGSPKGNSWRNFGGLFLAAVLIGTGIYFAYEPSTSEQVPEKPDPINNQTTEASNQSARLSNDEQVNKKNEVVEVVKKQVSQPDQTEVAGNSSTQESSKDEEDEERTDTSDTESGTALNEHLPQQKDESPQNPITKNAVENKADLCEGVEISATIHAGKTCKGSNEGSLNVSSIMGGKTPIRFLLNGKDAGSKNDLINLDAGVYEVYAVDNNGCKSNLGQYSIKEIACDKDEEYTFNPEKEGVFYFPLKETHSGGILRIFSPSGNMIYQKSFDASSTLNWTGKSLSGEAVNRDSYAFMIIFNDNTKEKGYITILK